MKQTMVLKGHVIEINILIRGDKSKDYPKLPIFKEEITGWNPPEVNPETMI